MFNLTTISQQIHPSFNNIVDTPNMVGTYINGIKSENEVFLSYLDPLDDGSKNYENKHKHFHKKAEKFGPLKARNFNYIGTAISVALRILSFLTGTLRKNNLNKNAISQELLNASLQPLPSENIATNNHDRVNSNTESLDIAMGTLMAFGGKYLRRTVVWFFDQIESNPQDKIENNSIGGYLESLSTSELETLATKAVAAGANSIKLQEAFITAQNTGNWNDLEIEIASVLGPEAVGGTSVGSGSFIEKIIDHASNFFESNLNQNDPNSLLSNNSISSETASGFFGPTYYYYQLFQNTLNRFDKVITNEPDPNNPQATTILQRFVKEFNLEKEAFTFQKKINSIIKLLNSFLGDPSKKFQNNSKQEYENKDSAKKNKSDTSFFFGHYLLNPFNHISFLSNKPLQKRASECCTYSSMSLIVNTLFLSTFGIIAILGTLGVGVYMNSEFSNEEITKSNLSYGIRDRGMEKMDYS